MSLYESTFIIRHDMSTQQVERMAESFSEIIKNNGGEVTKTEHWGLKTLAYRIKKNRKGHYVYFNIDAPSAAMQELERNLRLNEDVLRYLTVRVDEHDPEPSPMMQARASRDERSRRVGRFRDEAGSDAKASGADSSEAVKAGDKTAAKAEDKTAVKAEDKAAVKSEDKTAAKAEDKAAVKSEDKTAVKAEDKTAAKAEDETAGDTQPAEEKDSADSKTDESGDQT